MKPSDVADLIPKVLDTGTPIFLHGPPGVGKSSLVHQVAVKLNLPVTDLRAVLLDPVDLRGLPVPVDGTARWLPPAFLPRTGPGVLFLDELTQAPPSVQAALLQLTLDRRCGEYVLPDGVRIVAAGNRSQDRAGAGRLITPLLNRFVHVDCDVNLDDWLAWSLGAGIVDEVRAFIRFKPDRLMQFDAAKNERAFPSPRSWEFASRMVAAIGADSDGQLRSAIAGCVGDVPAAEFHAFLSLRAALPPIEKILADPIGSTVPSDCGIQHALLGGLIGAARGDKKSLAPAATYFTRWPVEFAVCGLRDLISLHNGKQAATVLAAAGVQDWMGRNKGLLLDANKIGGAR